MSLWPVARLRIFGAIEALPGGFDGLNAAIIAALRRWLLAPATAGGLVAPLAPLAPLVAVLKSAAHRLLELVTPRLGLLAPATAGGLLLLVPHSARIHSKRV